MYAVPNSVLSGLVSNAGVEEHDTFFLEGGGLLGGKVSQAYSHCSLNPDGGGGASALQPHRFRHLWNGTE